MAGIEAWRTVWEPRGIHGSPPPCKHFALQPLGCPQRAVAVERP